MTPQTIDKLNYIVRKTAHITEYTILTLLAVRALQFGTPKLRARALFGALALSVLYACTDEFHQIFVPGRSPLVKDVLIDSVGALLVTIATPLWFATKDLERRLHEPV